MCQNKRRPWFARDCNFLRLHALYLQDELRDRSSTVVLLSVRSTGPHLDSMEPKCNPPPQRQHPSPETLSQRTILLPPVVPPLDKEAREGVLVFLNGWRPHSPSIPPIFSFSHFLMLLLGKAGPLTGWQNESTASAPLVSTELSLLTHTQFSCSLSRPGHPRPLVGIGPAGERSPKLLSKRVDVSSFRFVAQLSLVAASARFLFRVFFCKSQAVYLVGHHFQPLFFGPRLRRVVLLTVAGTLRRIIVCRALTCPL